MFAISEEEQAAQNLKMREGLKRFRDGRSSETVNVIKTSDFMRFDPPKAQGSVGVESGTSPVPWVKAATETGSHLNRLHNELVRFAQWLEASALEHKVRELLIKLIQTKFGLDGKCGRPLAVAFGSHYTQLYLPDGDIDLSVVNEVEYSTMDDLKYDMYRLSDALRSSKFGQDVQVIVGARIPLVKFKCGRTGVQVDVSFSTSTGKGPRESSDFVLRMVRLNF